jgi:hypothetical protein
MTSVNKIHHNMKEVKEMEDHIKKILEFSIFISLATMPFIVTTSVLGIDMFLDSFESPESYVSLKNSNLISGLTTNPENYIIIQRINHPDFKINKGDTVLYFDFDGELTCNKINEVNNEIVFKRYYIEQETEDEIYIYTNQIVGKVIKVLDGNILTDLSLKIWDISIANLNIEYII